MTAKILIGDVGSVSNQLNILLKKIDSIISITQSSSNNNFILTVVYNEKIEFLNKEEIGELLTQKEDKDYPH